MANAYKCDICGDFFTKVISNTIGEHIVRLGDDRAFSDVCPKCTDLIQGVINERNGINDKEKET